MNREYHKWWSPRLEREMELLVFGHAGAKVLVFPTRGGRFHEYEDLRIVEQLRDKIEAGHLQLYCIDGLDSETFYCWWAHPAGRLRRYRQYEEYVLNEVLPFMQSRNEHECVISHGCSLGAFHAASIAFRYPHFFRKLAAFSGRFDLTESFDDGFGDLLSGFHNEEVYFQMPTQFLPNLDCQQRLEALRLMDIVLVIGAEDPFRGNNEHLSRILGDKGIGHQLHHWEGRAHQGYHWRRMAPLYL